jgi:hypothetical protein
MTTSTARQTFRETVARVAAKAKEKLPTQVNGRIEKAVALVLQGDVEPQADGTITVYSATDATRRYVLQGTSCTCADYERGQAPEGWCAHRIAAGIAKRVGELLPPALRPDAPVELPSGIDPRHVVMIQGKPFVKFAGLLELAHQRGLVSLTADWTANEAELSLAHAVATFADGRRFEESGDATPGNTNRKVALHFRRVALTRAKARVLRDALGVDMVAVEELAD